VGNDLTLRVRSVLADHHEGREKDGLERSDPRQPPGRVALEAEPDPAAEPGDVDVDERHRPRERGDPVGYAVLDAVRSPPGLRAERRVWPEPGVREPSGIEAGAPVTRRTGPCAPAHRRRLLGRLVLC